MKNYYIVRHGETEGNIKGIHQCRIDTPLTQKGIEQMLFIGNELNHILNKPLNCIYCSNIGRTKTSLNYLLMNIQNHTQQVNYTPLLLEQDMGKLDGLTRQEVESLYPGFNKKRDNNRWNVKAPGDGENYMMVHNRVKVLLAKINKLKHEDILIMGHKVINKVIVNMLLGCDESEIYYRAMPNGACYVISKYEMSLIQPKV